jgi:peptidoglycan/xylan/chitin deacetylase (PgdA/CDA1 family)
MRATKVLHPVLCRVLSVVGFFVAVSLCVVPQSNAATIPAQQKQVIFTFDDGPKKDVLEKLLVVLDAEGIKATFFVLGWSAKEHPELIKRLHAEGHDIQNHGWGHGRLDKMPIERGIKDIERTTALIESVIHKRTLFVRPPHLAITKELRKELTMRGYIVIGWDIGSLDWQYINDEKRVIQQVTKEIDKRKKGTVNILFHETAWTVRALPAIIKHLKANGWHFITLERSNAQRRRQ